MHLNCSKSQFRRSIAPQICQDENQFKMGWNYQPNLNWLMHLWCSTSAEQEKLLTGWFGRHRPFIFFVTGPPKTYLEKVHTFRFNQEPTCLIPVALTKMFFVLCASFQKPRKCDNDTCHVSPLSVSHEQHIMVLISFVNLFFNSYVICANLNLARKKLHFPCDRRYENFVPSSIVLHCLPCLQASVQTLLL